MVYLISLAHFLINCCDVHHHLETWNFLGDMVELDINATSTSNYGGFSNLESMFINHKFVFNSIDSLLIKVISSQNPYNGQNQRFMNLDFTIYKPLLLPLIPRPCKSNNSIFNIIGLVKANELTLPLVLMNWGAHWKARQQRTFYWWHCC